MNSNIYSNPSKSFYQQDAYLWIKTTIKLLKEGRFEELEVNSLIEEIERMSLREKRELKSLLLIVIEHLLKLIYLTDEKEEQAGNWQATVIDKRKQLNLLLQDSPSLKVILDEIFLECYQAARKNTLHKYQLTAEIFPLEAPFTLPQILNSNYVPAIVID